MNIICIAQQSALWQLHGLYEACLIKGLINRGASVDYFVCQGGNRLCDLGFTTIESVCRNCYHVEQTLLQRMDIPFRTLYDEKSRDFFVFADNWIASLDKKHLDKAVFHGYPVGQWVYSNFLSVTNQPTYYPGKNENEDILYLYLLRDTCANLLCIRQLLEQKKYDRALLFNGRISTGKVLWELAHERGITTYIHERGAFMGTMSFTKDCPVPIHDYVKRAWNVWKDIPLTTAQLEQTHKDILAREKRLPSVLNWTTSYSFTEDIPLLNGERGGCHKLWSVFTSSSNEFGALGPSVRGEFSSQMEWLEEVIEYVLRKPDIHIALRAHPGLAPSEYAVGSQVECAYFDRMKEHFADNPRVSVFTPTDTISSYALVRESDVVLAYATTVGVEAILKGKPAAFGCNLTYASIELAPLVYTRQTLHEFIDHWASVAKGSLDRKSVV